MYLMLHSSGGTVVMVPCEPCKTPEAEEVRGLLCVRVAGAEYLVPAVDVRHDDGRVVSLSRDLPSAHSEKH